MNTLDLLISAKRAFTNNSVSTPFAAVMDPLTKQKFIDELKETSPFFKGVLIEAEVEGAELLIVALGSCPNGRIYILSKTDFVNIIEMEPSINWEGWFND